MKSIGVQSYHGERLKDYVENALTGITKERFLLKQLHQYVEAPNDRKVCCLYGLRETGKKTMMLQELAHIGDYNRSLLLQCEEGCRVMQLRREIESYPDCRYIFIEEAVRAADFIDAASVLSDRYAAEGKKVVLTGTESLGFFIARQDELYDRILFIQPGLRYRRFFEIPQDQQPKIYEQIEICEQILKAVVLYQMIQTAKAVSDSIIVSRYGAGVSSGGFDVFVADLTGKVSFILEVTLSDEAALCQAKPLTDPSVCRIFEHKTGTPIRNRVVLYRGGNIWNPFLAGDPEKILQYINVETFLKYPERMLQTLLEEQILEQEQFNRLIRQ